MVIATPIQTVEPVLGLTPAEVQQIQEWEEGQTIQDILDTTTCEGGQPLHPTLLR